MAWTLTDLDALEAAIATGALSVQYQDRRVTYRSLEEMLRIRAMMRKALGLVPPGLVRDVLVNTDKGLNGDPPGRVLNQFEGLSGRVIP